MEFQKAKKFILAKLRKELPRHLSYHSVEHVKDVYGAVESIGKKEGIKGEAMQLLLTAALFHDAGFLKGPKDHEKVSCDFAREHLPEFGYNAEQIETICGMIMATRIPQSPHNLLEQIICDADLDYLGRDDFFTIGNKLFEELSIYGIISDEDQWNSLQKRFLESHHYFTHTALQLRKAKKDEHLALVTSKLN
jgi:predicted metal-dependent HD superfamily phosphohydrolase